MNSNPFVRQVGLSVISEESIAYMMFEEMQKESREEGLDAMDVLNELGEDEEKNETPSWLSEGQSLSGVSPGL